MSGSLGLYNALGEHRSFISVARLSDARELLERLLRGQNELSAGSPLLEQAQQLTRQGYLVSLAPQKFSFPSPLHMQYCLVQLYRGQTSSVPDTKDGFCQFLESSIMCMRASVLQKSFSKGTDGRMCESQYQLEW
jgi:hypothetical protein